MVVPGMSSAAGVHIPKRGTIAGMETITLIATAKFGLEALVKREVEALGFSDLRVSNGRVEFEATAADIPRLNIWLRCADRVLLKLGEFTATSFDELFEETKALPWEDWIMQDGRFPVNATTVKSKIQSERTTQAIVKKAIVERLKEHDNVEWFAETGPEFTIQATVRKDQALLTIDTSGAGLHKRGYRTEGGEAPVTETLAAAMVLLSFWGRDRLLVDPMCGSGTILIEAAMIGRNIAPGRRRSFAAEEWPGVPQEAWESAREEAKAAIDHAGTLNIFGYDVDAAAIAAARNNARRAGVGHDIHFEQKDIHDLWIDQQYGVVISNPPYGNRMADYRAINAIYITLNKMLRKKMGWSVYILTADSKFPGYFKRGRPNRVRKLYNGNIQANYYQYFGEKQPD
jgi:putative N6-adenine-specific DNA methylase